MVLRLTAKVCLTISLALSAACIGGGEPDPTETSAGALHEESSPTAACPDLSGSYECPAWQGQPAYALRVTNRARRNGVLYRFFYSFLGPEPIAFLANREGVVQNGFVSQCTRYNQQRALVFYPEGGDPATEGTYNFINADGDYQADFGGATQIVCAGD